MLMLLSLGASGLLCEMIDRLARPRRVLAGGAGAVAFRALVVLWMWTLALAIARRPLFAVAAVAVTAAIIVVISNLKHLSLREPLVFSDFAMLGEIVTHPKLFYIEPPMAALVGGAAAAIVGASVVWWRQEPAAVAGPGVIVLAGMAIGLPVLPLLRAPRALLDRWARAIAPQPRRDGHLKQLGLLGSLLAYWVRWLSEGCSIGPGSPARRLPARAEYDAIVIVQSESFVDLRRYGMASLELPAYDALKSRAVAAGLLEVPCAGAYTLRAEAAAITGVGFEAAGFDAFHRYLRSGRFAATALPNRLPDAWRKVFLHPHARAFFRRDEAIPRLGFDTFIDESSFGDEDRDGPYVGDLAVGRHILAELSAARRDKRPLYIHVVTMEAHDPFGPKRRIQASGPTAQFVHHLANADRMLALLVEELDREAERVLLVHYGDHVPILADFPDALADTRTDYLIAELGRGAKRGRGRIQPTKPEHLYAFVVDRLCMVGADP